MRIRYQDIMPPSGGAWKFPSPMRLRFSTESAAEDERDALLQQGIARTGYRVTLGARRDDSALSAQVEVCVAGGFSLASMTTNVIDVERTPSDVAGDGQEWFVVYRAKNTPQHYIFGNQDVTLEAGDIGVGVRSDSFRATSRDGFIFDQLLVPVGAVAPLLAKGAGGMRILHGGEPLGAVIGSAITAAAANCGQMSEHVAESVFRNIFSLAAIASGPSEEGRHAGRDALRAQQLETAKSLIERRLADPDLSPASVAAGLRISPRTLHALFEPTGDTFARYILERRLARCHAALTAAGASRSTIAELAFACGFNSLATFNRAFLRRFGQPPSDIRAAKACGQRPPHRSRFARNEEPRRAP